MTNPWHYVDKFHDSCTAAVSRNGNSEPCDKRAYAVASDDDEGDGYWPVCIYHARGRALVSLSEIMEHHAKPIP